MFSPARRHIKEYSSSFILFLKSGCAATHPRRGNSTRKWACRPVLEHFDTQYSEELREQWKSARDVLLNPQSWQYGVLLNRFSDLTNLEQGLTQLGYTSLFSPEQPQSHSHTAYAPLQCLIHQDPVRLPNQHHHPGWLKQYFLLNAASVLPVLALDVRDREHVLDLCAAPGGKCLAIMQTATPGLLHCNELDQHRHDWLLKTLESYIPTELQHLLSVTHVDGRRVGGEWPGAYDKVLVDAPCSNDRSWLYTPDTQEGELWLKKRAQLPLLQKELLLSALAAVKPGGVVVYSTCTMSRAENQSVVEAVLASYQGVELLDLTQLTDSMSDQFCFAHLHPPVGHLVIPKKGKTWGPLYVCPLKRVF